jgi:hypothetical protein
MCRPLWHDVARDLDAAAPNEKWQFPEQQWARLNRILGWLINGCSAVPSCTVGGRLLTASATNFARRGPCFSLIDKPIITEHERLTRVSPDT